MFKGTHLTLGEKKKLGPSGDPVTLHNVDSEETAHLALLTSAVKPVQTANYTGIPYLQKHQYTNQLS
jgi:hypothetical protein